MKLATWNINSLNVRLPRLLDWLAANSPDVVCLQETKLVDAKFPRLELAAAGYAAHFVGQNTYNGVALLVRDGFGAVDDVEIGAAGLRRRAEARHRGDRRRHAHRRLLRAERPVGGLGQVSLQARLVPRRHRLPRARIRPASEARWCWATSTSRRRTATSTIPTCGAGR